MIWRPIWPSAGRGKFGRRPVRVDALDDSGGDAVRRCAGQRATDEPAGGRLMRGVRPTRSTPWFASSMPPMPPGTVPTRSGRGARVSDAAARTSTPATRPILRQTRQARLSQAAIEVLAIVAYNESLTAQEISARAELHAAILANWCADNFCTRASGKGVARAATAPPIALGIVLAGKSRRSAPQPRTPSVAHD